MDFEKIWTAMFTLAVAMFVGIVLAYLGLWAFTNGKTSYCSFQAVQWSKAVEVVEHRRFSPDSRYTAPSFEDAMKYAVVVCPNFKDIQIEK